MAPRGLSIEQRYEIGVSVRTDLKPLWSMEK
jgi:hypothetical protein